MCNFICRAPLNTSQVVEWATLLKYSFLSYLILSYLILSYLTSLSMVTFPLLIVRNTFSLRVLTRILIFICHKQDLFFKFSRRSGQYGKYLIAYELVKLRHFRTRTAGYHDHIIDTDAGLPAVHVAILQVVGAMSSRNVTASITSMS